MMKFLICVNDLITFRGPVFWYPSAVTFYWAVLFARFTLLMLLEVLLILPKDVRCDIKLQACISCMFLFALML